MAEAREQDTGMDMIPGYERPTRSAVVDTAEQNVTVTGCSPLYAVYGTPAVC